MEDILDVNELCTLEEMREEEAFEDKLEKSVGPPERPTKAYLKKKKTSNLERLAYEKEVEEEQEEESKEEEEKQNEDEHKEEDEQ